jgi:hypothetical protein
MNIDRTRTEAEQLAKKIEADGKWLYEIPEAVWVDTYGGNVGLSVYKTLKESKYGYVRDLLVSLMKMMDLNHD